jgi:hypothetical protein
MPEIFSSSCPAMSRRPYDGLLSMETLAGREDEKSPPHQSPAGGTQLFKVARPAISRRPYDGLLSMETLAGREDETPSPHQSLARGTQLFKVARPATCCYMTYMLVQIFRNAYLCILHKLVLFLLSIFTFSIKDCSSVILGH